MKTFYYSNEDLSVNNIDDKTFKENKSRFDEFLIDEWLVAMKNGYFNFKLDSKVKTKLVHGENYSFVFQLNTKRFTEKRKAESINKINKPFDDTRFNFTKIKDHEILFNLVNKNENSVDKTVIIINNSPIEIGHVLLVPEINSCLNQVLNQSSIEKAIQISLLSNSYGFLVGFNSLCALASVNHLHFHAYYLDYILPIQKLEAKPIQKGLWIFDTYYLPAFVLQLSDFENDFKKLAKHLYLIANYLTNEEIAHNLMIVKGNDLDILKQKSTLRVVIWPRKAHLGSKDDNQQITFQLAICELSGHIVIKDEDTFNNLKESDIVEAAKDIKLEKAVFDKIEAYIKTLFLENN